MPLDMIYIHCTKKLLDELGICPEQKDTQHVNTGLGDWYANSFLYNRRRHIMFVNEKTRCGFAAECPAKKDLGNISAFFADGIKNILKETGIIEAGIGRICLEQAEIHYTKTASPSLVATMNDYCALYKDVFSQNLESRGCLNAVFNAEINQRPLGILKYETPFEVLRTLLSTEYSLETKWGSRFSIMHTLDD